MKLPDSLIKKFVRITNDRKPEPKEETLYGTAVAGDDGIVQGVQFDGSDIVTPCTPAVTVHGGDRVIVMVKNREAVITSNITNPSLNIRSLDDEDIITKGKLSDNESTAINGGIIDCDYLRVSRKIIVYAPVWDPDQQKYIGETDSFEIVALSEVNPYYSELWAFQNIDKVMFATPYEDNQGTMHYPEVQMYDVGVHTLKVADRAGTQKSIGLYSGNTEAFTVNANGYTDHVIEFPEGAFTQSPIVTVTPTSGSQAAAMGEISWAITAVTADDVTVRIFNNSASRYITLNWIAMGE
jgi:hypothetical protein